MLTLDLTHSPLGRRLRLHGRFDAHTANVVDDALVDDDGAVVLDLAGVDFIDSAGLALLVRAHARCARDGRGFAIAATSQPVRIILELTGLEAVLGADAERAEHLLGGAA